MNRRASETGAGGAPAGRKYIDLLKRLFQVKVDGRPLVELFREVPSPEDYPDYREYVDIPISLAEIVKRARLNAYDSDENFIADLDLMAENAKAYNGDQNAVYDDALDILDFALLGLGKPLNKVTRLRQQLQTITDLEAYKSRGRRLADSFMVEPDKAKYPHYYEVVQHPTSFTTERAALEQNGPYASWDEFRSHIEPIFTNAMLYNRENSQIYTDAQTLLKQLGQKIDKNKQPPKHVEEAVATPSTTVKLKLTSGAQHRTQSKDFDAGSADSDDDGDDDDDDEEEEMVAATRFGDDDDDEDFEADSDEEDEDDVQEGAVDEEDSDDMLGGGHRDDMMDAHMGGMPMIQQPKFVYDELTQRPPGQTAGDGMIQMVTVQTFAPPPPATPSQPMALRQRVMLPPVATDITQLRFSAPLNETFTTYSTTLPSYHNVLKLSVLLNHGLKTVPHQLTVVLNGQKMFPRNRTAGPESLAQLFEEFELRLALGLNQVTIMSIRANSMGFVRPAGPPPVVGAEPDEERMVLFLNLTK